MITLPAKTHIWIAAGVTDLHRGFDGLSALVQTKLEQSPFSGHVFVFRGRRGDRLYLLLSNESEQAIGYMVCKTTIMDEIEVVNSSGMRIPSGMELHYHKTKPTPEVGGCFGELKVEPGSCEVVNSGYLSPLDTGYDLKPGTYKIIEDHAPSHPISKIGEPVPPGTWLQRGLTITIEPADR